MKTVSRLLMVLLSIFVVAGCRGGYDGSKQKVWKIYEGKLGAYNVRVEESMRGERWWREVHMEAVDAGKNSKTAPFAITGHDYDGDGQFNEIFIRERYIDGYNSIHFVGNGEVVWSPCIADEGKVSRPTEEQLYMMQSRLYLAFVEVLNKEHLVQAHQ